MKRVLLFAYAFPPDESIGAMRPGALARHLPSFGWEPVVVTPHNPERRQPSITVIETDYVNVLSRWKRAAGLGGAGSVHERLGVPTGPGEGVSFKSKLIRWAEAALTIPDSTRGWHRRGVKACLAGLRERGIEVDAILSTSPPVTAHLMALRVGRALGVPVIMDLRDEWSEAYQYDYYPGARRWLDDRLARWALRRAAHITTISEPMAASVAALVGRPVHAIRTGIEERLIVTDPPAAAKTFEILYTGGLYRGRRDPSPLFHAVRRLVDDGRVDPNLVTIRILGHREGWVAREAERAGVADLVDHAGVVPREAAREAQRRASMLLLLSWDDPTIMTGKVFEYLAARRPILGIGASGGAAADLIQRVGAGVAVDRDDIDRIADTVAATYHIWRRDGCVPFPTGMKAIAPHHTVEMARRFAAVLQDALGESKGGGPT